MVVDPVPTPDVLVVDQVIWCIFLGANKRTTRLLDGFLGSHFGLGVASGHFLVGVLHELLGGFLGIVGPSLNFVL